MGAAESIPFRPSGSSILVEGGAPKATDGGFLLGVLCWEVVAEAIGNAHCSCSKAPCRCKLRTIVMSHGGLMAGKGDGTCVGLVVSDSMPLSTTSFMGRSWVVPSALAALQSGSS